MGMETEIVKLMMNEILPRLKKHNLEISECPVSPDALALLLSLKTQGRITHKTMRETLDKLFENR
jgi:Asp-tRNA(Asn)/Glu-tRNA(Gln) amidotransferase B subunit